MKCMFFKAVSLLCLLPVVLFCAEYQGHNVDGRQSCAFAHSLEMGNYYQANIVLGSNYVSVRFESGARLDLILDKQSVEDPEEVLAIDSHGLWWALSVDGLDESTDRSDGGNG
jgi:hypothetical protein